MKTGENVRGGEDVGEQREEKITWNPDQGAGILRKSNELSLFFTITRRHFSQEQRENKIGNL